MSDDGETAARTCALWFRRGPRRPPAAHLGPLVVEVGGAWRRLVWWRWWSCAGGGEQNSPAAAVASVRSVNGDDVERKALPSSAAGGAAVWAVCPLVAVLELAAYMHTYIS